MSWLPGDFAHPVRRLWQVFGPAWGWPPETMTFDEDRVDLLRHEREIAAWSRSARSAAAS